MKNEYLVQAILFDGDNERVIDSIKTNETGLQDTLKYLMSRHKNAYNYKYFSMEISSQRVTEHKNVFQA